MGWKNNSPPHPQSAAPPNSQKLQAEHTGNLRCKEPLTQIRTLDFPQARGALNTPTGGYK